MDKMSPEEVIEFIEGKNLVEFVPLSYQEEEKVLNFLRKRYPFHATSEGTFKVHIEVFRQLLENGFKIKKLD